MPFFNSPYRFGNLYMNFNIIFPKSLDDEQKKELKNLFPSSNMEIEDESKITEKYKLTDYISPESQTDVCIHKYSNFAIAYYNRFEYCPSYRKITAKDAFKDELAHFTAGD